eukprot:gene10028-20886_t
MSYINCSAMTPLQLSVEEDSCINVSECGHCSRHAFRDNTLRLSYQLPILQLLVVER